MCIDTNIDDEGPYETMSIEECSRKCLSREGEGYVSHFAFGTNDFGGQGCQDGICQCHCIEKCKELNQESYLFFKYKAKAATTAYTQECKNE